MAVNGTFAYLPDGGETGALVRAIDWRQHPLGDPDDWPDALKAVLGIIFGSRQLMLVGWGPEFFTFYNDAYVPSFGIGKHPATMGQRAHECWPEIWPIVWPQINALMSEVKPSWNEDHLVSVFRNGQLEDCYIAPGSPGAA